MDNHAFQATMIAVYSLDIERANSTFTAWDADMAKRTYPAITFGTDEVSL